MPMTELLLTLDCSNRWTCLGLVADGQAAGAESLDLGRAQAAELPLAVDGLLRQHGFGVRDITLLGVTVGPGYFTGIRIGMAYAAALAFALGVSVVPLSSLEVVLRSFPGWQDGVKVPLIAASRDAAFSSVWKDGHQAAAEKERTREELFAALRGISCCGRAISANPGLDVLYRFESGIRWGNCFFIFSGGEGVGQEV